MAEEAIITGSMASYDEATSELCFIAGKLHRRWNVWESDCSWARDPNGIRHEWRPLPSYDSLEEANAE
jgi:hypothetical protein